MRNAAIQVVEAFVAGNRHWFVVTALALVLGGVVWFERSQGGSRNARRMNREVLSCPERPAPRDEATRQREAKLNELVEQVRLEEACVACECEYSACGCPCEPCERLRAGRPPSQACLDERAANRARFDAMRADVRRLRGFQGH